jgi:ribosomal protein S12 methylthiotransferase
MPKVGFLSLGCPKNLVDSEVMMGILAQHGYEITARADEADVLVVNTCSFIAPAQQESVDTILEMAEHKTYGRATRLVVTGCLVERYREQIMEQIPAVDAVIGTGEIERIAEAVTGGAFVSAGTSSYPALTAQAAGAAATSLHAPLTAEAAGAGTSVSGPLTAGDSLSATPGVGSSSDSAARAMTSASVPLAAGASFTAALAGRSQLPTFLYHDAMPRVLATPRHSAYIKIAEGCDHPCAFCIIPQLRGKFRSRRFESVVREAGNLAAAGVREITLIGQDTTSYGEDLGLRDGLAQLLARLAEVEGLAWVRFLYAYPNRVTQRLLDTLAAHARLVKYMDMPLQHASRNVLARMKRGSSGAAFLRLIARARATIPGLMLRTSFITGYPGETEADFRELCDFVRAAEFDWMGVFAYSDVDNAASFALGDKVDAEVIAERRDRLMVLQRPISARRLRRLVGRKVTALVEGPSADTELVWEARLGGMAPEIDGKIYLSDLEPAVNDVGDASDGGRNEGGVGRVARAGDMVTAEITESHDYDVVGRVVEILESESPTVEFAGNAVRRISTGAALRVLA